MSSAIEKINLKKEISKKKIIRADSFQNVHGDCPSPVPLILVGVGDHVVSAEMTYLSHSVNWTGDWILS